ncbi:PaaI family thioesterase [Yinghuangia soli]|uniref:Medium/long-chain acyl-CoA thioesterase YigI n=1 Tax=Yinghuangia soli TaxID=2908204 RepID=A0AA41Q8W3_9ACTN|nr:PaaI family thioesterase [Yinghuangia soli]MCF2532347.1 PaaI family thioesterase [Yinghuangia soli]
MSAHATPQLDLPTARKTLEAQPFSVLLGARLTEFGDGAATLEVQVRDELRQQNGFVHGGVLAYLADNSLTFAAGTALGPAVLTAGFSITYVRPAAGVALRARATVATATRGQAVCTCEITVIAADGTEKTCAVAQGTARRVAGPETAG